MYVALSEGDGTFGPVEFVVPGFGYEAGGWRVDRHPRFLADLTGNGRADIVGFGDAGVYVALGNVDGTFGPVEFVVPGFGYEAGGWRVDRHPRFLADLTGNGRADIVGFGDAGVYVALSEGDGTFGPVEFVVPGFGYEAGGWRVDRHPRFLADLTGNGQADIVGFGDAGVCGARERRRHVRPGGVCRPRLRLRSGRLAGDRHPRFLADVTGDGRADIVGFGDSASTSP